MVDLTRIRQDLDRIQSKGDFRLQTKAIGVLMREVEQFVTDIVKADLIVKQIYSIEKDLKYDKSGDEDKRKEKEDLLREAKDAERGIAERRRALSDLEKDVRQLLSKINQVN